MISIQYILYTMYLDYILIYCKKWLYEISVNLSFVLFIRFLKNVKLWLNSIKYAFDNKIIYE